MKTLIALLKHTGLFSTALLLIASLSWSGTAAAAACESTNYDLNTQRDVDALGATGCDSVVGYMVITEWADITNLDGLANLTSVGGNLYISSNYRLTNLDGLANLTSVGGGLAIRNHSNLTSLEGLANLTSVGGELVIYNNSALISIGLANITSVGGYLLITDNDLLYAIFLANLAGVGGRLHIDDNDDLTNLDGLANLTSVGGDLQITGNYSLANCKSVAPLLGWPNGPPYDSVEGVIRITRNGTGCNSIAEVLASYLPPTQARFNALLKSIQAARGVDTDL